MTNFPRGKNVVFGLDIMGLPAEPFAANVVQLIGVGAVVVIVVVEMDMLKYMTL